MEGSKVKKIFILTGEASGDKLASKVVSNLKKIDTDIEYLSVGGENLNKLGVKSIFNLKEIEFSDKKFSKNRSIFSTYK